MDSSSSSKLILLFLLLITPPFAWLTLAYHFAEYIGIGYRNTTFIDVPINPDVDFHFIVSFAIDFTNISSMDVYQIPTNGKFKPYWNNKAITPSTIKSIKQTHTNVKVVLTLGSDMVRDNVGYFLPYSTDSWIENAITSLTKIITQYSFDGIDISYEHFRADEETFAECMGRVITLLKENEVISYASIAPFNSEMVQRYYQALWREHGHVIDHVNFQFYGDIDAGIRAGEFLEYFEVQEKNYNGGKMLVGLSSAVIGGLMPENGLFEVCESLLVQERVYGIFIWCAESSMVKGFQYEKQSQELLAKIKKI